MISPVVATRSPSIPLATVEGMFDLYRRQLESDRDPYLIEHAEPHRVAGQMRVFRWYVPYLPQQGAILDLGCAHGPDSCMLRADFGDRFELHGCDFFPADRFRVFRDFSRVHYTQLTDNRSLPYLDETFDCVIASGVLEHAAMDMELLKEIYRILKPGGRVVVSYLPNRFSVQEWKRRHIRQADFHRRLYGCAETDQLLKRTGFYPIEPARPQSFAWEKRLERIMSSPRRINRWAQILRTIAPVQWLSSTLFTIAEKVHSM